MSTPRNRPAADQRGRLAPQALRLLAHIPDHMPVIVAPNDYARWLGDAPRPARPHAAITGRADARWPISTRVNNPENDDASILQPIELASA